MRDVQRTFDTVRVACGLYLITGFIGAALAGAGLLQLLEGWPAAPALILLGGALSAAAWHRGRTVLEPADRASTGVEDAPDAPLQAPPRNHGRGAIVIAPRLLSRSPRSHDERHRRSTSG